MNPQLLKFMIALICQRPQMAKHILIKNKIEPKGFYSNIKMAFVNTEKLMEDAQSLNKI